MLATASAAPESRTSGIPTTSATRAVAAIAINVAGTKPRCTSMTARGAFGIAKRLINGAVVSTAAV